MSKKKVRDPYAQREAEKYDNPVPSREFILEHLENTKAPATHPELCKALNLKDEDSIEAIRRRLIAMSRDGQLICNRRGQYVPTSSISLIKGRVQGHKDGFGFVIPEDGTSDLFLTARQMRSVVHGDIVLVRVDDVDQRGRRMAIIVEVLERNTEQVVGRLCLESGIAFVTPENTKIANDVMIPLDACMDAKHGQYVVVEITQHPTVRTSAVGKVVEVMGDHMAPGMEIDVAIRSHSIPFVWPAEVIQAVKAFSGEVAESDKQHRVDIRHLPLVTIDGEDARDFDDAVYCEPKKSGGWRLYVAIADVAHYVKMGQPLDVEAFNRGNSVYFPDHVVPMLPEILSNGLCSLNPEVDRLCMVCEMTISEQGALSGYKFYEGVMHSHARLTYTKVSHMLEHPESNEGQQLCQRYADILPHLHHLFDLYHALRFARDQRGAIDFETVETRILFGDERKIEQIVPTQRNEAHKIIEECMLSANVATARFLKKNKMHTLYRVHEGPGPEKLENLREFLGELGLHLYGDRDKPKPADYQALLAEIKDRPDFSVIQTVMLRSLSQAVYSPEEEGHFGLGYPHYAHFTSPIRRYPDLTVHRAIKSVIHSEAVCNQVQRTDVIKPGENPYHYDLPQMIQLGEHCSMTERRADEATRDVVSWLKCEFLQQHLGETFEGIISGVTSFGFFVELKDLYIDGLVHVSSLKSDYYHYDQAKHRLVGERTGVSYRLGDTVNVQVIRIDLDDRKIDFEILGQPTRRPEKSGGAARRKADKGKGKPKGKGSRKALLDKMPEKGKKKKTVKKGAKKKGAAKKSAPRTAKAGSATPRKRKVSK
ncbi:ribonuclease R [Alkalimarinus sediminis]|uniref:Ribonuclease R n=1 Tax=Alkalimarinus sediminis TaxID=1632866 RepID=A0A9E8KPG9_9ALTE|nr:ribonuclease R [Alkalimarinus sediminis]UZW74165.1 ribonuclease R [Alkalimarinus sediminis]